MADHTWRIRKADAADAGALAACIKAAYAHYAGRITDLPAVSEGTVETISQHQVWVAVEADEIIAGLVLIPEDKAVKLANVAVHPNHGGKGLGRELIALSEREAMRQGYREMRLNTHAAMPENVRLYTRLGWEEISRAGNTVSMRKHLDDAP